MTTTNETASLPSAIVDTQDARRLVATYCCACHLPLTDADSVELGIGPVCRKKAAKADVGQAPDWDAVADDLAKFAAVDPESDERRIIFELAMDNLDAARRGTDVQVLANIITHYVAAVQHRTAAMIAHLLSALEHMGRPTLAAKIRENLYTVRIERQGSDILVRAPYSEEFRTAMWQTCAGRWDKAAKAYRVPDTADANRSLWQALRAGYPGTTAIGPRGEFLIK